MSSRKNSSPHADQYLWAEEFEGGVFCVAIVVDLTVETTLARLGVMDIHADLSLPDVAERAYKAWDGDSRFVASTQVGGDAVTVEPNGYICSVEEFLRPLSLGTAVYSFYNNVNAQCQFSWYADGEQQLWFDPLWPADRTGAAATQVEPVLAEVGFDLDADFEPRYAASSFALAGSLSGVRLTRETLDSAVYLGGYVHP